MSRRPSHTPGPWHQGIDNPKLVWSGRKIESVVVASCEREEDARLIAAMAEMIEELNRLYIKFGYPETGAVIAKVTGRAA